MNIIDNLNKQTDRQKDIDILRGFGILSVIWYHFGWQNYLFQYIASFHMILFFCVSGYCYKKNNIRNNPKKFFFMKVKSFLKPYFIWIILFTFLGYGLDYIGGRDAVAEKYLFNILEANRDFGAVWFLVALFITTIIGGVVIDFFENKFLLVCVSLVSLGIGLLGSNLGIPNVFRWEQALFSVPAFICGYIYHTYEDKSISIVKLSFRTLLLGLAGVVCSAFNGLAILSRMDFGENVFLFYFGALASVVTVGRRITIGGNGKLISV